MKVTLKSNSANLLFKILFKGKEFNIVDEHSDMYCVQTPLGRIWVSKSDCECVLDVYNLEVKSIQYDNGESLTAKSFEPLEFGDLVACKMEDSDSYSICVVTRATRKGLEDVPYIIYEVLGKIDNSAYNLATKRD